MKISEILTRIDEAVKRCEEWQPPDSGLESPETTQARRAGTALWDLKEIRKMVERFNALSKDNVD